MSLQRTDRARRLRRNATDAEKRIWELLRRKSLAGHKFRRQHPIGSYVADFASPGARLIVEIDGGQHALQMETDERRSTTLQALGWRVLRFWNNEVLSNPEGVARTIEDALNAPKT